jgi:hypothetical protein
MPKASSTKAAVQAAIERLEQHRQQLLDDIVAKGRAVRVPSEVIAVGGEEHAEDAIAEWKARKTKELRDAGETKAVLFDDPTVICTGVPRAGTKYAARLEREIEAGKYQSPISESRPKETPIEESAPPRNDVAGMQAPEVEASPPTPFIATVRRPRDDRDPGMILEASYVIVGSLLRVTDNEGKALGSANVAPGDDLLGIARRITREWWAKNGAADLPPQRPASIW